MRHAKHDRALQQIEKQAEKSIWRDKYIIIVYDGPDVAQRDASYVSNVGIDDVEAVCDAIATQIRAQHGAKN